MDSSDFNNEEHNYVLMENFEEVTTHAEKVPKSLFKFDTENAYILRYYLKSLQFSFRNKFLENARLITKITKSKKRNDHLEAQLVSMMEIQEEYNKSKHMETQIEIKCDMLEEIKGNFEGIMK